jgi:hypothetical protein
MAKVKLMLFYDVGCVGVSSAAALRLFIACGAIIAEPLCRVITSICVPATENRFHRLPAVTHV